MKGDIAITIGTASMQDLIAEIKGLRECMRPKIERLAVVLQQCVDEDASGFDIAPSNALELIGELDGMVTAQTPKLERLVKNLRKATKHL